MLPPDIKILHIEPTDVCQAACPLCLRETNAEFDKRKSHHLSVAQIKALLPESWIAALDKMFMCGVYGDPAAGHHSLAIYDYFRALNPSITLGMNTNGGIRETAWWQQLATIFNRPTDYVVFSVDGLQDTNHLYRVNVNWDRVMSNAETFIRAGGQAHWDMLVYKHNEHQIDACEQLARSMGFSWFRAKVSKRPLRAGLEFPSQLAITDAVYGPISCQAQNEKSIYMDASARITACCWLAAREPGTQIADVSPSWNSNPHKTCQRNCGTNASKTVFQQQWRREIALK